MSTVVPDLISLSDDLVFDALANQGFLYVHNEPTMYVDPSGLVYIPPQWNSNIDDVIQPPSWPQSDITFEIDPFPGAQEPTFEDILLEPIPVPEYNYDPGRFPPGFFDLEKPSLLPFESPQFPKVKPADPWHESERGGRFNEEDLKIPHGGYKELKDLGEDLGKGAGLEIGKDILRDYRPKSKIPKPDRSPCDGPRRGWRPSGIEQWNPEDHYGFSIIFVA